MDPIHHHGLHISVGAFRTSVSSLYTKTREMSLKQRRKKLSVNCILKVNPCPNIPAYSCVLNYQTKLFVKFELISPLGFRDLLLFEDSKIGFGVADDVTVSDTSPWGHAESHICLALTKKN